MCIRDKRARRITWSLVWCPSKHLLIYEAKDVYIYMGNVNVCNNFTSFLQYFIDPNTLYLFIVSFLFVYLQSYIITIVAMLQKLLLCTHFVNIIDKFRRAWLTLGQPGTAFDLCEGWRFFLKINWICEGECSVKSFLYDQVNK